MDRRQIDELTKMIATSFSRRMIVRRLTGAVLVAALARVRPAAAQSGDLGAAESPGGEQCLRPGQKCDKKDGRDCCRNSKCKGGHCRCKSGTRVCQQRCLPLDRCCVDTDCAAGQECRDGDCRCLDGTKACGDACIPAGDCCDDGDCRGDETCQDGACRCPAGTKSCGGNRCVAPEVCCEAGDCRCPDDLQACGDQCIPPDACCANGDCPDDRVCDGGSCVCPEDRQEVDGRCVQLCSAQGGDVCPSFCQCKTAFDDVSTFCTVANDICTLPDPCQNHGDCRADEACMTDVCDGIPINRCVRLCTRQEAARKGGRSRQRRR